MGISNERRIQQFESTFVRPSEVIDDAKYRMTSARRLAMVFPSGTQCYDTDLQQWFVGDEGEAGGENAGEDAIKKIFPDMAADGEYVFKSNETNGLLGVYRVVNDQELHKGDLGGSMHSDYFKYTIPMGGLVVQGRDGYNYDSIRSSPAGNGISTVAGNYASRTTLASNVDGVWTAHENQVQHDDLLNITPNAITAKRFSLKYKASTTGMLYGGVARRTEATDEDVVLQYRAWATDFSGNLLYENATMQAWNATDDAHDLEQQGAESITITAGELDFELPAARPMPTPVGTDEYDIVLHWEFKEPLTLRAITDEDIMYNLHWEEIEVGQVATREWVNTAGGGSGNIWATNITGSGNIDITKNDAPDTGSIKSVKLEQKSVNVFVEWDRGSSYRGVAKVNNVDVIGVSKDGSSYSGYAPISGTYDEITLTVGEKNVIIPLETLNKPTLTATFTGEYPVGQTELKLGDTYNILITPSEPITGIEIANHGACSSASVSTSALNIRGTIKDSGDVVQDLKASVRIKNSVGTWSDYVETTNTVKCNDVRPTINYTRTYPATQLALKDSEEALISYTAINSDGETTSAGTGLEKTTNGCKRISGDYFTSYYTIEATRTANGAVKIVNVPVRIANTDVALFSNTPVQVRSGAGSVALPCSFTQDLLTPAPAQSITATDASAHSVTVLGNQFSVTNLAGKTVDLSRSYFIKGFVQKTLTLTYPEVLKAIGTNIVTLTDLVVSGSINSTPTYEICKTRVADASSIGIVSDYYISADKQSIGINLAKCAEFNYSANNDITITIEEY